MPPLFTLKERTLSLGVLYDPFSVRSIAILGHISGQKLSPSMVQKWFQWVCSEARITMSFDAFVLLDALFDDRVVTRALALRQSKCGEVKCNEEPSLHLEESLGRSDLPCYQYVRLQ